MSLDPRTNRVDRDLAKAAEDAPPDLEPAFPYPRVNFDPFFFAVTVLTPPEEGADE